MSVFLASFQEQCQQIGAGRSVAIVAAYLMVTQGLDADAALEVIRRARPDVQ